MLQDTWTRLHRTVRFIRVAVCSLVYYTINTFPQYISSSSCAQEKVLKKKKNLDVRSVCHTPTSLYNESASVCPAPFRCKHRERVCLPMYAVNTDRHQYLSLFLPPFSLPKVLSSSCFRTLPKATGLRLSSQSVTESSSGRQPAMCGTRQK